MAWTTVECSECGEEYRVQMYGPHKTREWKVNNWNGICDDCKDATKAELIGQNQSGDLQELTGSDKQIAWAMKIRAAFISKKCTVFENITKEMQELLDASTELILAEQSAHWWIESRDNSKIDLLQDASEKLKSSSTDDNIEEELQADVEAESVIRPLSPVTETIANISLAENKIAISFKEKNDDFKEIVKTHGYRWNTPWEKKLSYATGNIEDRIAEIGHALLADGFQIRVLNTDIHKKIKSGDFEQEHTRWISVLIDSHPDSFYIAWNYNDNLYDAAKRITGARYEKPGVIVDMEQIDEVMDFADIYKYKFSPGAKKLIERAKKTREAATVISIHKKNKPILPSGEQVDIKELNIPETVDIDDELKD